MKMRGFANFKNSLEQEVYLYIKGNLKETECTPANVIFIFKYDSRLLSMSSLFLINWHTTISVALEFVFG